MRDITAERFLLSSISQNGNNIYSDISDIINEDCFSDDNKYIYKVLEKSLNNVDKIDITNFMSTSKDLGYEKILSSKNNLEFIKSLFNTPIVKENSKNYAVKLRKLSIINSLQNKVLESHEKLGTLTGNEDIEQILSIAEEPVAESYFDLGVKVNRPEMIFENSIDYYKFLEENQVENPGISTGFPFYDEFVLGGGLRRGFVNMLISRPKGGKSAILIRIARYISCILKLPVLYLDTEMNKESFMHRILAADTGIPYKDIETGKFGNSPKKHLLYQKVEEYQTSPLHYINIAGKSFDEILSIVKRWLKKHVGTDNGVTKDCVVIYDYFKLMNMSDLVNLSEHASIGYQLQKLCDFMKINDVACLSACQANRDGISKESTDVVAGSDRITWFCSSLCLLRKKSQDEIIEEQGKYGNRKLIPLDALRFSEGLPEGNWINYNFNNFNFQEIGLGPQTG